MARPRVIPVLSLLDGQLVKTVAFGEPRYVGDPVNILSIFSEFAVDELLLLDIRATIDNRPPDLALLAHLAEETMIPMGYGGGLGDLDTIEGVLAAGFEKVVLGAAAVENPALVSEAAARFGSQAVVVSIDVKGAGVSGEVVFRSGSRPAGLSPVEAARSAEAAGAGELLVVSVDLDGTMTGYDLELVGLVAEAVRVPVVAVGGAGRRADLAAAVGAGASAAAAGSLFVFQGPQRAVLVNYPSQGQLDRLFVQP